jgi:hypothetical protein
MKNISNFINESSNSLKAVKLENIPGKDLYCELIKSIQQRFEKDIKNGCEYLQDNYDEYIKNADGSKINDKATYIIANWAVIDFKDKSIKQQKWDGKRYIITDESISEIDNLFKTYWDKPVINGWRQSTRDSNHITPRGSKHLLKFKFPDGTTLSTNLSFGPLKNLLKYATEKDYDSINIDKWE